MNKCASRSLLGLWIVTLVAAGVFFNQNQSLRREKQMLAADRDAALAGLAAAKEKAEPDSNEIVAFTQQDKLELMRLRNEVTQSRASDEALKASQATAARLAKENQDLRVAAQRGAVPTVQNVAMEPANPNAANGSYDPLAFYKKNPELMKRYFPHLFREGAGQDAAPTQSTEALRNAE